MSDEELDALQTRHLAYRAELGRKGTLVVNGPFDEQSDPSYRGMSIFACDAAEAARLSEGDPSVVAGRLAYDVMEWWVRAGSLAFPFTDGRVGDRDRWPTTEKPPRPAISARHRGPARRRSSETRLLVRMSCGRNV